MTKSAHFLLVKTTYSGKDYAKLYLQEVICLGSKVNLNTDFHPQTDGQAEHTIKTLEDMLRACVIDFKGNWRRPLEFEIDYWVYLKVSPMKVVMKFGNKKKLSPRYNGPYRISKRVVPTKNMGIKDNLSYEEVPIVILDCQVCKLRTKEVASVKVLLRNQFVEEATWEAEEDMKKIYPNLFESGENVDQGTKFSS
ncbi:uncharacterized protein [Solanum lycopersicum]|uniref:uncharacterized protein n=1 Tax=Solanum lycopersicum TaxID=4081 RepID=UPI0037491DD6